MTESKSKPAAKKAASADSDSDSKTVTLTSPWGTKVTVPAESADLYLDGNFTK